MKPNQVELVYGLLALLVILLLAEYYVYYNFIDSVTLSKPLLLLRNFPIKIGPIVRVGFVIVYFISSAIARGRNNNIQVKKYPTAIKPFIVFCLITTGLLFIMVHKLPYIVILYPVILLAYIISSVFYVKIFNVGSLLKDDFNIKMDSGSIENDYSFNFQTDNGVINVVNPFAGILVLGAAGSGKSVSIAEPVIEQMTQKEYSGVVYDFKFPTLTGKVYTEMKKYNKGPVDLYIINFNDLTKSHRVNIFSEDNLPDVTYAFEYTTSLINNLLPESIEKKDFWIRSASTLLTATIWYLRTHHKQYCTLPHVVDLICNGNTDDLIDLLTTDLITSGMIKNLHEAKEKKASAQLAGVLSTLQSTLVTINNPKIFWVLTGSDFTMDLNNPKHPKMLCIGTSEDTAESLSPVVSCMVTVAVKQLNKKNRQHSIVLLDEAPQLFIPKLSNLPATGRSNKVVTMFMAQNIPQIIQLYTKQETDSILGNLSTQFYGRARDLQTAEYVSKIFGKEEKVNASLSTNSSANSSKSFGRNESFQMKELVKPQDVYNLKTGFFYGVTTEAKYPTFHGKVQIPDPSTVKLDEIPVFTPDATEENINRNYARIREEITALLAGVIPRDRIKPNAG